MILPGWGTETPAMPAVTPVPKRDDPSIAEAAERQRQAELRRKGRAATILTGGKGVEDELGSATIARPRAAQLLGE